MKYLPIIFLFFFSCSKDASISKSEIKGLYENPDFQQQRIDSLIIQDAIFIYSSGQFVLHNFIVENDFIFNDSRDTLFFIEDFDFQNYIQMQDFVNDENILLNYISD